MLDDEYGQEYLITDGSKCRVMRMEAKKDKIHCR